MGERAEEPGLFDLPLTAESGGRDEEDDGPARSESAVTAGPSSGEPSRSPARSTSPGEDGELPLFADSGTGAEATSRPSASGPSADPRPSAEPADRYQPARDAPAPPLTLHRPTRAPQPAPFSARLLAAAADLGVHAAVAAVAWAGTALTGARLDPADLPALGIFLLAFSFLYSVVSLAFWGRTPGMAAARVVARGPSDQPLTFGQTGLRWLAALLTALLAGLPLLIALTGRSLPDRLSGSQTLHSR